MSRTTPPVGDAAELVRLLVDPQRLAIAGRLAVGPLTVDELGAACALTARDLRRQLPKLIAARLVVRDSDGQLLRLNLDLLRRLAAELPRSAPIQPHLLVGLSDEDAAVAARYFEGGRLTGIPVGPERRRVILNILVDEFEPGRYFSEAEVRRILRKFHPDDAALRRYLVDDQYLARDSATRTYWRAPGPPPKNVPGEA